MAVKQKKSPAPAVLPRARWFPGRVLAIDPSSTAMGLALIDGGEVLDCWRVRTGKADPHRRADFLARHALEVAGVHCPEVAVIETERAGAYANRGIKGLMSLCHAQGTIRGVLAANFPRVVTVSASVWTRGLPDKAARAEAVAHYHPVYAEVARLDAGYDVADAVGVGLWWIARNEK